MLRAIAFDMDGTLIDSNELVVRSYQAVFQRFRPEAVLSESEWVEICAPSYHEIFTRYFPGINEDELLATYMMVQDKERSSLLRLFPGVDAMLAQLKVDGYLLALITSEYEAIAKDELSLLGILNYFDMGVYGDTVIHPKPHAEPVERVLQALHLKPHELLFVGDQRTDWESARAAKVRSGAVGWTPLGRELARSYRPRVVIDAWIDFPQWVSQLRHDDLMDIDPDFILQLPHQSALRVIQFTDLHLMNDEKDERTFRWIQTAVRTEHPDLVVLTGDLTMSPDSRLLYQRLAQTMEALQTPWTFIFGNHDTDHGVSYDDLIEALGECHYLLFSKGNYPMNGVGNFAIRLESSKGDPLQQLIFLDSGSDYMYPVQGHLEWGYQIVGATQIEWVDRLLSTDQDLRHSVFVHIPLSEYHFYKELPIERRKGEFNEGPSTAPFNPGLLDVLVAHGNVNAVFCGHDHYNDYEFVHEGILLAFGRVSGHYDYGTPNFPKGARMIEIQPNQEINSFLLFERDYGL